MSDISKRLKEYIKFKGYSISGFEKNIYASNGYVNNCKNITKSKLRLLNEKFPDLSIDWVLTGEGEMIIGSTPQPYSNVTTFTNKGIRTKETTPKRGNADSELINNLRETIKEQKNIIQTQKELIEILKEQLIKTKK